MTATGTAPAAPPQNARRGVLLALAAVVAFTAMDSLLKYLSGRFPVNEVFLFRWVFALPPILAVVARNGGRRGLATQRLGGHMLRSALSTISLFGFIYAFGHLPLASVVAISFAAPVLVTALSAPMLGERVDGRRWAAVLAGFGGVLVITRPGSAMFGPDAGIALLATLFYASGLLLVRRLASSESTAALSFYLAVSSVVTGLCLIPLGWTWPQGIDWALLVAMGTIGGTANMLVTAAYRAAPVATVAPLDYTLLIGTTATGYLVFNETPDLWVFAGAGIVAASGLAIIWMGTRR